MTFRVNMEEVVQMHVAGWRGVEMGETKSPPSNETLTPRIGCHVEVDPNSPINAARRITK
jgi:hypothetical protein